ncbi:hypothetical protein [Xanthomonas axonopodis]|uniref:hypothetical protein n=1 Tax=Xanthomonas axonopodis TaxID=53413 RepID=UPI001557678C|nr:hypothetical protein [Xanthomonas axonopodis]
MDLPSLSGTLSSFMGEKVPAGRMRGWFQAVLEVLRVVFGGAKLLRPCGRESLFFACAKKSNQKKAHPVLAPCAPAALRVRKSGRNFCKEHPCPLQKRRASMRAALRVVSAGLAAAAWSPDMQTAEATATATATAKQ